MAWSYRALSRNCSFISNLSKPLKWSSQNVGRNFSLRVLSSETSYKNIHFKRPFDEVKQLDFTSVRKCATKPVPNGEGQDKKPPTEPENKTGFKGLVLKFKHMYKDYWYVLLPVHMATSAVWFGSFYYAVRSGVDVISILESCGISDSLLEPLKKSGAGYFALAFALYKLITPLRYAVTVGGTTYAIKKLTSIGVIKPVPSRERFKEMLQEKKEMLQEKRDNLQDRFIESKRNYQTHLKEKRSRVLEEMSRYKSEMRNMKNKVKKM